MASTKIMIDTIDRPRIMNGIHGAWVEYEVSGKLLWDFRRAVYQHVKDMCSPVVSTTKYDRMRKEFNKVMKAPAGIGFQDGNLIFVDTDTRRPEKILRFATKEELAGGRENIKWLLNDTRDLILEPILIEDDGIEDIIPYPVYDVNELYLPPAPVGLPIKINLNYPPLPPSAVVDPAVAFHPNWSPPDPDPDPTYDIVAMQQGSSIHRHDAYGYVTVPSYELEAKGYLWDKELHVWRKGEA